LTTVSRTTIDWALFYYQRGWSVIPVTSGNKKQPAVPWTKYQSLRADESQLRRWFDPAYGGQFTRIGIVLGPVSGRLAVRDFDIGERYDEWAERYPEYARVLPTVRTKRGAHVYLIVPADSSLTRTLKFVDGELRYKGGIVVVPPSLHSHGVFYEWIIPLPAGAIREIDPSEIGMIGAPTVPPEPSVPEAPCVRIREGARNSTLISLAGTMRRRGMSEKAIRSALLEENRERCTPPLPDAEVEVIAKSAGRYEPSSPCRGDRHRVDERREPMIVNLGDVQPEAVSWLWPAYIPNGKLTILEGDPGVGKTTVALQIAAMVTRGHPLPDVGSGVRVCRKPAAVVYLSAEDGLADTLRPRLDAADADVTRVHAITGVRVQASDGTEFTCALSLQEIAVLDTVLALLQPSLVVVDPLQAYLGSKVDMHRANETRPVLAALAALAEKHHCAILCIRHLGKSSQERAVYRGLGSIDFAAAARSIILAAHNPINPVNCVLAQVKCSLSPRGKSLGYQLRDGRFYWTGVEDISAEDLLRAPLGTEESSALDEASSFLKEMLNDGARPSNLLKREARRLKISDASLRRAKSRLGVVATCQRNAAGRNEWLWSQSRRGDLPARTAGDEHLASASQDTQTQSLGPFNQGAHVSNMHDVS